MTNSRAESHGLVPSSRLGASRLPVTRELEVRVSRHGFCPESEKIESACACLHISLNAGLTRRVDELTRRLDKRSKNSSSPPSADLPKSKADATKARANRRTEAKAKRHDDGSAGGASSRELRARASRRGPIPTSSSAATGSCPSGSPTSAGREGDGVSELGPEPPGIEASSSPPDPALVFALVRAVAPGSGCFRLLPATPTLICGNVRFGPLRLRRFQFPEGL
jgi:hypothetical protein